MSTDSCLLVAADLHCGHLLGLKPPDLVLVDDQGQEITPPILATQRYLWTLYQETLTEARAIINNRPFAYLVVGDITHGKKYPEQLVSTCIDDQFTIATACIDYVARIPNCKAVRVVSGTAAHSFGEATSEKSVVARLKLMHPEKDVQVLGHFCTWFGDHLIDVAHHGPGAGIRQWTRGNIARLYLVSLMWQEFKAGRTIPRLVIRAHYHNWVRATAHEWFNHQTVTGDLTVMPSWCGMTEHARQATASQFEVMNGMMVVETYKDQLLIHELVKDLDVRVHDDALSCILAEVV